MAGHWTDLFSFVTGSIREADLAYLVLSNDKASERKIPSAGIVQWEPDAWGDGGQVPWRVAGTAITRQPLEQLCAVGEFGEVLMLGCGDHHEERIGKGKKAPKDRGPLRGVRSIEGHVYCVGMDRQIYRREGANKWVSFDIGIDTRGSEDVVGFESIDGFSAADIYACGWDGEVWHFDGKSWGAKTSPVNSVLVDICCAGDGSVYACGRNGLLIKGRHDQWETVDVKGFSDDLWSLAWYKGKLYLASMEYVFVLGDKGLQAVDMGKDTARTCYDLTVGADKMWSIGAKDVMSFDGKKWTRID